MRKCYPELKEAAPDWLRNNDAQNEKLLKQYEDGMKSGMSRPTVTKIILLWMVGLLQNTIEKVNKGRNFILIFFD